MAVDRQARPPRRPSGRPAAGGAGARHGVPRQRALEDEVARRTEELEATDEQTLLARALAAEDRDGTAPRHTLRVGAMAAEIGVRLGLDPSEVQTLREAAAFHDVGKLAIPEAILLKPGRLSEPEYELMKRHAAIGERLLSRNASPVLQLAAVIAASHHERWDGSGYPGGLAGEAIPLSGRIVAVADVFDALTHDRPYKSLWPVEQAISEIRGGAGSQFDPRVVEAFLDTRPDALTTPGASRWAKRGERTAGVGHRPGRSPSPRSTPAPSA